MKLAKIYGLLLVGFTTAAQAQIRADTLTISSLNEAIATAKQQNPTQAIYQQQLRQAAYNYKASRGFLYPNASAGFTGNDNLHLATTPVPGELVGRPGTTFYAQFGKQYAYTTGIALSQNIFDWSFILQSKLAQANVQLLQGQQAAYAQTLKEQAARLYFSALIAKSALTINKLDKQLADSLQTLSQLRLQEGTSDLLAANQARINYANMRQNQAQSQQLLDQSTENLKIVLGEKPATELKLTEKLIPGATPTLPASELQPDKTLGPYETQASIAATQSRLQRAAAYPVVATSAFVGDQQFRDDFGLAFGSGAWNAYRYVALTINVPLFTGFTNSNKNKSAAVQTTIAQLQLDQARQQSAINDRLLLKNQADYLEMVTSSAISFKLYGDNLRLNQQKYREGILTMDACLKSFQDYLISENLYLNNLSLFLANSASIIARQ